jgi:hypothetical protein
MIVTTMILSSIPFIISEPYFGTSLSSTHWPRDRSKDSLNRPPADRLNAVLSELNVACRKRTFQTASRNQKSEFPFKDVFARSLDRYFCGPYSLSQMPMSRAPHQDCSKQLNPLSCNAAYSSLAIKSSTTKVEIRNAETQALALTVVRFLIAIDQVENRLA